MNIALSDIYYITDTCTFCKIEHPRYFFLSLFLSLDGAGGICKSIKNNFSDDFLKNSVSCNSTSCRVLIDIQVTLQMIMRNVDIKNWQNK